MHQSSPIKLAKMHQSSPRKLAKYLEVRPEIIPLYGVLGYVRNDYNK